MSLEYTLKTRYANAHLKIMLFINGLTQITAWCSIGGLLLYR
jgi:hypothetical protein